MADRVVIVFDGAERDLTEDLMIGHDLDKELDRTAAQVAFWGVQLSKAQRDLAREEAAYRHWKAEQSQVFLDADPRLAEAKLKARVEALPQFEHCKAAIAEREERVNALWAIYSAFRHKADLLRSKASRDREMYRDARIDPDGRTRPSADAQRTERMADLMDKTRKPAAKPQRPRG